VDSKMAVVCCKNLLVLFNRIPHWQLLSLDLWVLVTREVEAYPEVSRVSPSGGCRKLTLK